MGDLRTIPPRLTDKEWNALLDHGLEKNSTYILRSGSVLYEAVNGSTGKIDYSGSDTGVVLNNTMTAMANGGQVLIKGGTTYATSTTVVVPSSEIYRICGEDRRTTVLKAVSALSRIIDGRNKTLITIENLRVDGNGFATTGIDFSNSASAAREHQLINVFVRGCTTSSVDLTGAEDTLVERCRFHGDNNGVAGITNYGIVLGGTGGVTTNGMITLQNCVFGFNKLGDVWAKSIENLRVFGCMFGSLPSDSPSLKAQVVIDNTGPCEFFGSWFEGYDAVSTTPNILIENTTCRDLALYGCRVFGNRYPIIYSTVVSPNRACFAIEVVGGVLEPRGTAYAIQCPTYSLTINNTDLEVASESTDVDLTNVAYYWIKKRKASLITSNLGTGLNTGSGAFSGNVSAMSVNLGGTTYYVPLYTTTGS